MSATVASETLLIMHCLLHRCDILQYKFLLVNPFLGRYLVIKIEELLLRNRIGECLHIIIANSLIVSLWQLIHIVVPLYHLNVASSLHVECCLLLLRSVMLINILHLLLLLRGGCLLNYSHRLFLLGRFTLLGVSSIMDWRKKGGIVKAIRILRIEKGWIRSLILVDHPSRIRVVWVPFYLGDGAKSLQGRVRPFTLKLAINCETVGLQGVCLMITEKLISFNAIALG